MSRKEGDVALFQDVLARRPADVRALVLERLYALARESAIMQQMRANLDSEHQLLDADWEALIEALRASGSESDEIQQAIRGFCRAHGQPAAPALRIPLGRVATLPKAIVLGRIVPLADFCGVMVKLGFYNSSGEARKAMREAIGMSPQDLALTWENRPLGQHLMWSTFDPVHDEKPFGLKQPHASNLLCALGLSADKRKSLVLALEYRLPSDIEAHVPTFCDAYSGIFWSRYFRSAAPSDPYGLTMPTDSCPRKRGRPEVVHSVISLASLTAPLRYAI